MELNVPVSDGAGLFSRVSPLAKRFNAIAAKGCPLDLALCFHDVIVGNPSLASLADAALFVEMWDTFHLFNRVEVELYF